MFAIKAQPCAILRLISEFNRIVILGTYKIVDPRNHSASHNNGVLEGVLHMALDSSCPPGPKLNRPAVKTVYLTNFFFKV